MRGLLRGDARGQRVGGEPVGRRHRDSVRCPVPASRQVRARLVRLLQRHNRKDAVRVDPPCPPARILPHCPHHFRTPRLPIQGPQLQNLFCCNNVA